MFDFRIKSKDFLYYRSQIIELFPTEPEDLFYIPYCSSKVQECESDEEVGEVDREKKEEIIEGGESTGPSGTLYNYYRTVRNELRNASILIPSKKRKVESDSTEKTQKKIRGNN